MKNYLNILILVIFGVLILSVSALISKTIEQSKEIKRKTSNIIALNSNLETYRNFANQSVAKNRALTYTNAEYRTFKAQDTQTINQLEIRLKNALNTTTIETITETKYETRLIQIKEDTCFNFSDKYTDVSGCITSGLVKGKVISRDSLFIVVHTERAKKFWFIKYGLKVTNVTAKTANPNTTILGIEHTVLKR
jgi:type II secretory pathway pseudopilin PulG